MSDSVPRKKKTKTIAGPLLQGHKVTQDKPDFDKDKKVSTTVEGKTSHPSLDTPHKCDNKRDYKGDKNDETPVSMKSHPNVLKKDLIGIKRDLEKERENSSDEEYVPSEHLKGENIKYHSQENLIN